MKKLNFHFTLAGFLRVLGAMAVIGSGLIYMLQGLDTVDIQLRNWAYLILMLVLAVGGIASFSFLQDRKGARLFFGLAALIIPIQFSQLGGMVFNYVGGGVGNLIAVFQFTGVSSETLWLTAGLSIIASLIVAFASFSILSRPYARWLSVAFIVSNLLILVPVRELPLGLLVLGAMLIIVFQLERKLFSRDLIFKTFEGISTRILASLPLIIVFIRSAFHQDEFAGLCVLTALFAVVLSQMSLYWLTKGRLKESLLFSAWVIGAFSSFGITNYLSIALNLSPEAHELATKVIVTLPFIAWTAYFAAISQNINNFYRLVAVLATATLTLLVFKEATVAAMLIAGVIGIAMLAWGYSQRARLPIIFGALILACSIIGLIVISIQQVDVNTWLALAISGVVLVTLSSVAEKYGRNWLIQGRESLENFSNWPA